MINVNEAIRLVEKNTSVLKPIEVDLLDARGLVLAESIKCDMNVPPLNNSAMDGFAVRAVDQAAASKSNPAILKVTGTLGAGKVHVGSLKKGEALRIMTGAPIPKGADAVVRQEDTDLKGGKVSIFVAVKKGDNIRKAGEDLKKNEIVARAGDILTPALIGVIASSGPGFVMAHPMPVVAVLATGDEVVPAGVKPGPGQIRSSNSYTMHNQAIEFGAIPVNLGIARDTKKSIRSRIEKVLGVADVLLTSGGISVGKYDFVAEALNDLGFEEIFYKVKQRPGQPLAFGRIGSTLVFAMPGNPVSGMVCALEYVRPAIRKMMGFKNLHLPEISAVLDENMNLKENRTYFFRGVVSLKNGQYHVKTTGPQGSGILRSMALADSLVVVGPDKTKLKRGETVRVQLLENYRWPTGC